MTIEQLRSLSNAQPFLPFVIHLADGREVPVRHPELIMEVPSGGTILVCQGDDTVEIIDLPQVTGLEVKPRTEGPGRKRRDR